MAAQTTVRTAMPTGAPRNRPRSATTRHRVGRTLYYVLAIVVAMLFLFPLIWALIRSLQGTAADGTAPTFGSLLHLTLHNYTGLFGSGGGAGAVSGASSGSSLWHYAGNSVVVGVGTAIVTTVVATLAGYGLARLRFRGSGIVFMVILAPFMVPFQAILTSLFTVLTWLGITNSLLGLILVYSTFQLPFTVYIMRNSFSSVPKEIEEAAYIDGASTLGTLARVMVPLVRPGIVTVILFAFVFAWNEFLAALMLLTSDTKMTLPVALNNLASGVYGHVDFGQLDAGAVIAMTPCLVVFLFLQRAYVRGITAGAGK
jgi:multiple sugar transport system permease protein